VASPSLPLLVQDHHLFIKVVAGGYVWDGYRDLFYLNDEFSPIIIQTGRASVYGSFEKFQEEILKAPLTLQYTRDDSRYDRKRLIKVEYTGPNSSGYSRTYPNFMTQEGIRSDEEKQSTESSLMVLFNRMLAGAGDQTVCYFDPRVDELWNHAYQLAKSVGGQAVRLAPE